MNKQELARYVLDERRREAPIELRGLEYLYSRSRNYLAAWHAIDVCARAELPLPNWVMTYLGSAAPKLIDDVPLARALGATKGRGGRGSARKRFQQELDHLRWFVDIENVLEENPKATVTALVERIAEREDKDPNHVWKRYYEWRKRLRGKQRIVSPPL